MQFEWEGVFPAMITPMNGGEGLDMEMFEKNMDAQLEAGVHGFILGGSLGEAALLSSMEKEIMLKYSVARLKDSRPVIMNIAENSTREAVQQAQMAEQWGASGLMLLPPMRYKADHRECVQFFRTVAKSVNMPVMIYNNPVDYKIEVTLEMFDELLDCENITAIKESTRDVINVTRLKNRFGGRYKILCGVDPLALEELCLGAEGWVAGLVCAYPRETVALYNLVKTGRMEDAIKLYRWFMPLLELDIHAKLVQYIKLAATVNGISQEYVRAPRLTLAGEEREQILHIIHTANAANPLPTIQWR